ncbi:unnamed protein product, partial [Mesorhabditis spiculigera]
MALALSCEPADVLLKQLIGIKLPYPTQPVPSLVPPDSNTALSFASVGESRVACFVVGGEPRLCLPQVRNTCLPGCDEEEVLRLIQDLHIHLVTASQQQMEALKLADAIPQPTAICDLIKKTDTERLLGELRGCKFGRPSPGILNDAEKLFIKHDVFGGCKGNLYPSLYPKLACIECYECRKFFEPPHFLTHNHLKTEIIRTVHWGFDANNWRLMLRLQKRHRGSETARERFEDFLAHSLGSGHYPLKRPHVHAEKGFVKRFAVESGELEILLLKEQARQQDLIQQIAQMPQLSEAAAALLQLGQQAAPPLFPMQQPCTSAPPKSFNDELPLNKIHGENDWIRHDENAAELAYQKEMAKQRPDSENSSSDEDTLDSLLAEHIEGDALQAVRNRIADVQRGLRIQLEEVSNERDNLRIENETLRAQNATLTHILQQQSQKHISPVSQLQLQTAKAGSSSGAGLVSPVNSLLLLQLLQQQQQQQQQIQQQTQIANQLATMDCSLLGSLTSQLLATGSGVGSSVNPKAASTVGTANVLLAILVLASRKLRRQNELIIIAYYCFNESLLAFGGAFYALRRTLILLHPGDWPLIPRIECLENPFLFLILYTYHSVPLAEILLTVDRILALYYPFRYLAMPAWQVLATLAGVTCFSLLTTLVSLFYTLFLDRDHPVKVSQGCYLDVYAPFVYYLMYFGKVVLYITCILLYLPVLWRVRKIMNDVYSSSKMRATARSSLLIGLLIMALLVFIIIPTGLLTWISSPEALLVFYNVLLIKPWMNVVVAMMLFRDLRVAFFAILRCPPQLQHFISNGCGGYSIVATTASKICYGSEKDFPDLRQEHNDSANFGAP